jgi:cytochrome c oxidase assembly factor CtaG
MAITASTSAGWPTVLSVWPFDPATMAAIAAQAVAAALYLIGVGRLARRGRRWPARRTVSFLAGVALLVVAVDSPMASYDDSVFAVHLLQHLLLMMAAPLLLIGGRPVRLAVQAASRPLQMRLVRLTHRRPVVAMAHPVMATALAWTVMAGMLQPGIYRWLEAHPAAHDGGHVALVVAGCLWCWRAMDGAGGRRTVSVSVAMIAATAAFSAAVSTALLARSAPIAPAYSLADTRTGAIVFLIGCELIAGAELAIVVALPARLRKAPAAGRPAVEAPGPVEHDVLGTAS